MVPIALWAFSAFRLAAADCVFTRFNQLSSCQCALWSRNRENGETPQKPWLSLMRIIMQCTRTHAIAYCNCTNRTEWLCLCTKIHVLYIYMWERKILLLWERDTSHKAHQPIGQLRNGAISWWNGICAQSAHRWILYGLAYSIQLVNLIRIISPRSRMCRAWFCCCFGRCLCHNRIAVLVWMFGCMREHLSSRRRIQWILLFPWHRKISGLFIVTNRTFYITYTITRCKTIYEIFLSTFFLLALVYCLCATHLDLYIYIPIWWTNTIQIKKIIGVCVHFPCRNDHPTWFRLSSFHSIPFSFHFTLIISFALFFSFIFCCVW